MQLQQISVHDDNEIRKPLQGHSCCQSHRTPLQGQVPRGSLRSNMTLGQWPRLFFCICCFVFDVCYFFDVSFHKRRAEFVAMPRIATYRISGRPLIPIVYSSCFLLLPEPQTAQTARPRSSSVEKRRLYYFHLKLSDGSRTITSGRIVGPGHR